VISEPFNFLSVGTVALAFTDLTNEIKTFKEQTNYFSQTAHFHQIKGPSREMAEAIKTLAIETLDNLEEEV